jgi:5-methylcytosine-specific restriction endonuclease McrA
MAIAQMPSFGAFMSRREFSKPTKREALKRSGLICEAVGERYGLQYGTRCQNNLGAGVNYDHAVPDGLGGDNCLENCLAVCPPCHRFKTSNDVAQIAKSNRQRDKRFNIRNAGQKLNGAGFAKAPPQNTATKPLTKRVGYIEEQP